LKDKYGDQVEVELDVKAAQWYHPYAGQINQQHYLVVIHKKR
jgi:hypothetical protein